MTKLKFRPPVIAHRGASAYAPENTMAAFVKALQLGIKWVEFDVMLAACGNAVIFHDELLDRTTSGHGKLSRYPYVFLQTLDAGSWFHPSFAGEKIPLLATVLNFLQENNCAANIELKPKRGQEEMLVKEVLKVTANYFSLTDTRILFSSFSTITLAFLRNYTKNCHIGLLLDKWVPGWQALSHSLNCVSLHMNQQLISSATALTVKSLDKALLCYTVNTQAHAKALYALGVDAVFSDYPDRIIETIALP